MHEDMGRTQPENAKQYQRQQSLSSLLLSAVSALKHNKRDRDTKSQAAYVTETIPTVPSPHRVNLTLETDAA